jgi:hypothetical protein
MVRTALHAIAIASGVLAMLAFVAATQAVRAEHRPSLSAPQRLWLLFFPYFTAPSDLTDRGRVILRRKWLAVLWMVASGLLYIFTYE